MFFSQMLSLGDEVGSENSDVESDSDLSYLAISPVTSEDDAGLSDEMSETGRDSPVCDLAGASNLTVEKKG